MCFRMTWEGMGWDGECLKVWSGWLAFLESALVWELLSALTGRLYVLVRSILFDLREYACVLW